LEDKLLEDLWFLQIFNAQEGPLEHGSSVLSLISWEVMFLLLSF
jgi:hypothetical protein